MDMRDCKTCGQVLPLEGFHKTVQYTGKRYRIHTCKDCSNTAKRASTYGITVERCISMRRDPCALCGTLPTRLHSHIDHCHTTGEVRGVLCQKCNLALGWYEKNIRPILPKVEQYLGT